MQHNRTQAKTSSELVEAILGNLKTWDHLPIDIEVLNNSVDNNVFKPTPSDIKEKYCISDKKSRHRSGTLLQEIFMKNPLT